MFSSKSEYLICCVLWMLLMEIIKSSELLYSAFTRNNNAIYEPYCETESFNATCDPGYAILITHAQYGRMQLSRCAKIDYGHIGCSADVIELTDTRCSGRRTCEINIPDALFAKTKPCPEDLKPYLEAGYSCVPVETPMEDCPPTAGAISVSSSVEGLIANMVTEATGCGTIIFPWVIESKPGQRIHLVLYDFNVDRAKPTGYTHPRCPMYAIIRERLETGTRKVTVCGGLAREKSVYTSTTNRLELGIAKTDDVTITANNNVNNNGGGGPYFFFRYEVIGCTDLAPIVGAWLVRNGDHTIVKCNNTKEEFHLKCVNKEWTGDLFNCTLGVPVLSTSLEKFEFSDATMISYGSSIMIMIVTALGIGLLVLTAGLIILARRKVLFACSKSRNRPTTRDMFSDYDNEYVTSVHAPNSLVQLQLAKRYSYGDPTNDASRNSFVYSSGELTPNTPLVSQLQSPPACVPHHYHQHSQKRICCSGCQHPDRKLNDVISAQQRYDALPNLKMETKVFYTADSTSGKMAAETMSDNRTIRRPGMAHAKAATLQTDDIKLQKFRKSSIDGASVKATVNFQDLLLGEGQPLINSNELEKLCSAEFCNAETRTLATPPLRIVCSAICSDIEQRCEETLVQMSHNS